MTKVEAATILDNDTNLENFNVIKNADSNIINKIGLKPNTAPPLVATALPPLKLIKIENTCPIAATKPKINT